MAGLLWFTYVVVVVVCYCCCCCCLVVVFAKLLLPKKKEAKKWIFFLIHLTWISVPFLLHFHCLFMFVFLTRSSAISEHTCKDFTCGSNGFCIHPDLLCDGINHCSDNSDESVHNLCQSKYIYITYLYTYIHTDIYVCMYTHHAIQTTSPLTKYRVLAAFRNLFMYPFCQWCMWQEEEEGRKW